MENVKDQWERNKAVAEILLKENKKVYIKDSEENLYFADILFVGEDSVRIICFAPEQRKGEKFTLYFPLIVKLNEYKEEI